MKVLVFGRSGQVAQELARRAGAVSLQIAGSETADFRDPARPAALVRASGADAVINAAAYTAVDRAEEEEALARTINGDAPGAIAQAAAECGIPLVHISTDYVFDGSGTEPWQTGDPTGPLGAYGRTKLAGEIAVAEAGGAHVVLRTSWVVSAHGSNFVRTMLRLGAERDVLRIVADQVGGPTPAAAIADACLTIATALRDRPELSGPYHFSGAPDVSWAEFARAIFDAAGIGCDVSDIPSAEYPTPARRPGNSRLDCSTTQRAFGLTRPDWRAGLSDILSDLGATAQ